MKKGTIKEFGKLLYDFAKIGLAVAVVAPLVKGEHFSLFAFAGHQGGTLLNNSLTLALLT